MKRVFLDLESLPVGQPDFSDCIDPTTIVVTHDDPDIKPDRRLKDPEKVAADIERKRAALQERLRAEATQKREDAEEYWRRGSLNPMRGRVLCVGLCSDDQPPTVLWDEDERALLEQLQELLLKVETAGYRPLVTTWHGSGFDIPFLIRRALHWGLYDLARILHRRKMRYHPGDLMNVWKMDQWNRTKGEPHAKLDDVCAFLGIGRPDNPIGGADVLDRYLAGDHDAIRAHVAADVEDLRKVCRVLEAAGMC